MVGMRVGGRSEKGGARARAMPAHAVHAAGSVIIAASGNGANHVVVVLDGDLILPAGSG